LSKHLAEKQFAPRKGGQQLSKGLKITALTVVFLILLGWIAAPAFLSGATPGSEGNPLISLDYLETVVSALRGELTSLINQLRTQLTALQDRVEELEKGATSPTPPATPQQPLTLVVHGGTINFRPAPATNNTPLARLAVGTKITGLRLENGWYQARLQDGTVGFISADFARPDTGHVAGLITGNAINIRTGPGTNHSITGAPGQLNDLVRILKTENGWHNIVTSDGRVAWISASWCIRQ
jgi:hypothetical protein